MFKSHSMKSDKQNVMTIDLTKLSDRRLQGLFRVAKTRAKAFFRDPYAMILLRAEMHRRGLCQ